MSKFAIAFIMIAFCSFFSFSFYESLGFKVSELSTVDQILNQVFNETLIELRNKYSISIIGAGGEKKDKKKIMIALSFMLNRSLTKDECRELLIDITETLLKNINKNNELKPYLYHVPFPYKNLEIRAFLRNPDRSSIIHPHIFKCSMIQNLEYDVRYPHAEYGYTEEEETFEDALKIVQAQRKERECKDVSP